MPKLQPPPEFSLIHTQSLSADWLTTVPHPTWAYRRSPSASLSTISSTLWLFFQSSFHLSLAVLVRYRALTWSRPNGALTLSGAPFQETWAQSAAKDASPDYNSNGKTIRF
ncbi:hypothetical protein DM860_017807 [Cuscuta australis]|uniref:Uncharacterized protein n=1 Tax=Cuscuta australis TaxID=267555 RepID=A0A328DRY9_9ASTE|nr:hypothetical protein DM860_017807 [Cuscuta australis]